MTTYKYIYLYMYIIYNLCTKLIFTKSGFLFEHFVIVSEIYYQSMVKD